MIAGDFSRVLLLAPVIFVCHFLEESPTFVTWFNSHVNQDITSELFWIVNISALVITVTIVAIEWFSRSAMSLGLAVMWLSFLMLANAAFHLVGGLVDQAYVPGLVTAAVLYVPYYAFLARSAIKARRVSVPVLVVGGLLASLPMLIHGYLILFRGSRLF